MRVDRERAIPTRLLGLLLPALLLVAGCASNVSISPGSIPTATPGDLHLSTDRATYTTNQPVGVTLTNSGQTDYYSVDGHSACTVLQVQRYDGGQRKWLAADECTPSGQPRPLLISAGMREPFTLAPTSSGDANAWQPGLYRVGLQFTTNTDGASNTQMAYSAGFVIQS